jgi:hypothetical protein
MEYLDKTVAGKAGVLPELVVWPCHDTRTSSMSVQAAG